MIDRQTDIFNTKYNYKKKDKKKELNIKLSSILNLTFQWFNLEESTQLQKIIAKYQE